MLGLLKLKEVQELAKQYKLPTANKASMMDDLLKIGLTQSSLVGNLTEKIKKE